MSSERRPELSARLDIGVYGARGIPSTYSGFETFLTAMLPRLVERGHQVTMYCRKGEVAPADSHGGVRLVHTAAVASKSASTLTHGLSAGFAARRARHDVVLVVNVANAPYCAMARWSGQPVVLNTDGQEWLRGKWGPVARSYFRGTARLAKRSANALVSDCDGMRRVYADEFGAESTVIPYAFDVREPTDDPQAVRDLGLEPRQYLLVGGRLIPENNIDRIVARHLERGSDAPIAVLGEANYRSPVSAALSEMAARDSRVRLLGHVGDRDTYVSLLRLAGRYLHGHSVGGINPSLVEAMGAGARIAALATSFNVEALNGTGETFTDVESSMDQFLRLPVDMALDRVLRESARQRAAQAFRQEDVVDAYEALLVCAASARRRGSVTLSTQWSSV